MLSNLAWYVLGFVLVWFGAGLAVRDIDVLSKRLHFTSFAVSFLFLGFFTSLSELSVGVSSVVSVDPEIFVGNLIGASIVLFLLVIPLLAVAGNGLTMVHSLQRQHLILSLIVIAAPVLLAFDQEVSLADALIMLGLYGYLFKTLHEERGIRNFLQSLLAFREVEMLHILAKMLIGVGLILFASRILVSQTEYFALQLGVSPFVIGLLLISVGTNVPELSIAARSLFLKRREVALGNYLGSAAFNTLLMGALTMLHGGPVAAASSFLVPLVFTLLGLGLFYRFGMSGGEMSRAEGLVLLGLYILFVFLSVG